MHTYWKNATCVKKCNSDEKMQAMPNCVSDPCRCNKVKHAPVHKLHYLEQYIDWLSREPSKGNVSPLKVHSLDPLVL